jgi:hypothetical protein
LFPKHWQQGLTKDQIVEIRSKFSKIQGLDSVRYAERTWMGNEINYRMSCPDFILLENRELVEHDGIFRGDNT